MVKHMVKIGRKTRNESLKRSIDVAEATCLAFNAADNVAAQAYPFKWVQTHEDRSLQIEFERKRALGIIHSRNTFG